MLTNEPYIIKFEDTNIKKCLFFMSDSVFFLRKIKKSMNYRIEYYRACSALIDIVDSTVFYGLFESQKKYLKSSSIFSGGNYVKIWDALAGGKLLTTLSHHHKTVTCLAFCSGYQRLMSGGLDRYVFSLLMSVLPKCRLYFSCLIINVVVC